MVSAEEQRSGSRQKDKHSTKCECGGRVGTSETLVEGFVLPANVCEHCGEVGLPLESAKRLLRLREEARRIESRRKVLRIGNSIGITLPAGPNGLDLKEGETVEVRLIGEGEVAVRSLGKCC